MMQTAASPGRLVIVEVEAYGRETVTGGTASSNIGQMWALNALQPPVSGARRRLLSSMIFPPFP